MSLNRNPNTKINVVREDIQSEYSEELKLNVRCFENDNHVAVVYCIKCEISLCKMCSDSIHSSRALSNHEIVRLTQKPEPPINCYLHLDKTAELICKEPSCKGVNKPICTTCHQYQTHKNHKFEMIEDEFNKIRYNIAVCLKGIETNQRICEINLEEYDKCISSYSIADPGFMKNERDKVDEFYSDLRKSALKKFDNFVNDRIEKLNISKNRYQSEKEKLDSMSSELRNMKEMKKVEVIKSGKNVEKLKIQAGKLIDKPTDLLPSKCYDITLPNIESKNIGIDLSENYYIHIQQKILAVYLVNRPFLDFLGVFNTREALKMEYRNNGELYKYKDGQFILYLEEEPNDDTIDLSLYKYIIVIYCQSKQETEGMNKLREKMNIKWYSRIIVAVHCSDWDDKKYYVDRIREIAKTDNRVKVIQNDGAKAIVDSLLES